MSSLWKTLSSVSCGSQTTKIICFACKRPAQSLRLSSILILTISTKVAPTQKRKLTRPRHPVRNTRHLWLTSDKKTLKDSLLNLIKSKTSFSSKQLMLKKLCKKQLKLERRQKRRQNRRRTP